MAWASAGAAALMVAATARAGPAALPEPFPPPGAALTFEAQFGFQYVTARKHASVPGFGHDAIKTGNGAVGLMNLDVGWSFRDARLVRDPRAGSRAWGTPAARSPGARGGAPPRPS